MSLSLSAAMGIQKVVCGGTHIWYATLSKNTEATPTVYAAWDLTGATITLTFVSPAGVATHCTASIVVAASGTVHYTNLAALFSVNGNWSLSWKVSQSGVVLESQQATFAVYPSAAAL